MMAGDRATNVSDLLERAGPSLTGDLARLLRDGGVSSAAARQRLSRLPEEVRILHGLPFPRKSRFIYLESQFNTDRYWTALINAINAANPSYAAALAGVRARGGILPKRHFDVVSGAPIKQKGQLASSIVLTRLQSVSLLNVVDVEGFGDCVVLGSQATIPNELRSALRARLLTESFLLNAIKAWLGRMNLASPNVTRIRDDSPPPQFATFCFDICGPCYLRPLTRIRDNKVQPGFLVADVIVGRTLEVPDVNVFTRKCATLGHLRKVRPFVPMLISDGFSPEALRSCRSQGIIATTPETLFGRDVARALGDLLQTLTKAAATAAGNPEKIERIFERLSAVEGAAGNLRGALFEVLVGHLVRAIEGGSIDIGVLVLDPRSMRRAETDVRLVKEQVVQIYECKGYQPSTEVSEDEIRQWLERKVPIIYSAHQAESRFQNCRLKFGFWTCGKFSAAAKNLLRSARKKTRKYDIDWKDGAEIKNYASQLYAPGIRKILNEHYFKHPLS